MPLPLPENYQRNVPPQQIPQSMMQQALPLDRSQGQSYDGGEVMSMQEAIAIAAMYGAVPSRISSGSIDTNNPNPMGVWGIPTANGFVPITRAAASNPTEAWQGGPPSNPRAASYGGAPSVTGTGGASVSPSYSTSPYSAPPSYSPQGVNYASSYTPSTSGPMPGPSGGRQETRMPYASTGSGNQPIININFGGGDGSNWMQPRGDANVSATMGPTQPRGPFEGTGNWGDYSNNTGIYATPQQQPQSYSAPPGGWTNGMSTPLPYNQTNQHMQEVAANQLGRAFGPQPPSPVLADSWRTGDATTPGLAMWQGQRGAYSQLQNSVPSGYGQVNPYGQTFGQLGR